ncbi:hypothetical protein A3860_25580 [Niastella vici]|uniref:DUF7710 domain-containing protein n=1 Tax=Niastella vici TaxID=1703345 RepID=A0A1V9FY38_9BACT|nr:hypothetical protein [Niastella vici]OQP63263.1 hypothetical protein A3860_25580 [Niastella vici]
MEIWVFNGAKSHFPSGVFSKKEIADAWIAKHKLTGVLTKYPVDEGVYDWSLANGTFKIKKEEQTKPEFIQRFSSASQEHYHYEDGIEE